MNKLEYPSNNFSYVVGAVCAVCGMVFTGLPIPIIASNFNLYYTYAKTKMIMVENTLREIRKKKKQGNFQRTLHRFHYNAPLIALHSHCHHCGLVHFQESPFANSTLFRKAVLEIVAKFLLHLL